MKARKFSPVVVLLAAVAALAVPLNLMAQNYPVKPVRIIVPFAPGGGTDIQARVLAKELNEQFRQIFIVDNRPGASGLIGAELVVNAPADGYTLLFTTVPYKGGGFSMVALMSGEVDFQFAEGLLAAPQIRPSKARALAVTTEKPSPAFPDLPTMHSVLPGLISDN